MKARTIAYGVIFLLLAAVTVQSYFLSVKIDKLNAANSNLDAVKKELTHKQDSINLLSKQASTLQLKADSLGEVAIELKKNNEMLTHQLDNILSNIDSIPPEENYRYLQDTAYRYLGKLEFPFNAKQVTEIRKTHAENVMIKKINVNLATTVNILQKQIVLKDSLISNQYVQLDLYAGIVETLKTTIDKQGIDNTKLRKDAMNQKRIRYIFEGGTFIGIVYIILTLI